jgi:homoserine O-acetyltransferase
MDALMPLACLPVELAGRNRLWRKMVIEGTKQDPNWRNGDYTTEPRAAVQIDADFLMIAGSSPMLMQKNLPNREQTDKISRRKLQAHLRNTRCQQLSVRN